MLTTLDTIVKQFLIGKCFKKELLAPDVVEVKTGYIDSKIVRTDLSYDEQKDAIVVDITFENGMELSVFDWAIMTLE